MLVRKLKLMSSNEEAPIVCSRDEQFNTTCKEILETRTVKLIKVAHIWPKKPTKDMQSNGPVVPIQDKMKHIMPQEDDKNCQSTKYYKSVCSDKKCQETNLMPPVKLPIHMQSVTRSSNKKLTGLASDKNSQAIIYYKKQKKCMCSDKNCQENINMWPVMPEMDMWLPKPAVLYQYRRLCNDKNCQSTRCYKKKKL